MNKSKALGDLVCLPFESSNVVGVIWSLELLDLHTCALGVSKKGLRPYYISETGPVGRVVEIAAP